MRSVRRGDLAFRVIRSPGPATATVPTHVLVHGIGASHRYLKRLHEAIAETAPVVSIDLPGFGGLPKPADDVDVVRMATALCDVMASLDVGPVVLVGHSMGAQWAVEATLQRPDLVSNIVAMGPVTDERHRTVRAQAGALVLDTLREPPLANAVVLGDYLRCGPSWYGVQVLHMIAYPMRQKVAQLTRELLIIRGGVDPVSGRAWCRMLRDAAASATLVEIPGRPHVAQFAAPRAVAAAIRFHTRGGEDPE